MLSGSGIKLIQDSAQSFGAFVNINGGQSIKSCSVGFASCLSINSMKLLPSHGEGGAVFTSDTGLAEYIRRFRYQGCESRMPQHFGLNGRMETVQAAITLVSLQHFNDWLQARQSVAAIYFDCLSNLESIALPERLKNNQGLHTYYSYQILVDGFRDQLRAFLNNAGVETQLQYNYLLSDVAHLSRYSKSSQVLSRRLSNTSLCLPCHEKLSIDQVTYVAKQIKKFVKLHL